MNANRNAKVIIQWDYPTNEDKLITPKQNYRSTLMGLFRKS